MLDNKLNVATDLLYDCNYLSGRNTQYTVCKSTWPVLLLNGFCTLNRFICGWCNHKFAVVWFGHDYFPFTLYWNNKCRAAAGPDDEDLFWKAKVRHGVVKVTFHHEFIAELAMRHIWKWRSGHVTILSKEVRGASIKCVSAVYKCSG